MALQAAVERSRNMKEGVIDSRAVSEFAGFLDKCVARPMKDHQFKAALYLLRAENGANFSVPGSGKTTVVLAVFHRLRKLGQVDALFVVGQGNRAILGNLV